MSELSDLLAPALEAEIERSTGLRRADLEELLAALGPLSSRQDAIDEAMRIGERA